VPAQTAAEFRKRWDGVVSENAGKEEVLLSVVPFAEKPPASAADGKKLTRASIRSVRYPTLPALDLEEEPATPALDTQPAAAANPAAVKKPAAAAATPPAAAANPAAVKKPAAAAARLAKAGEHEDDASEDAVKLRRRTREQNRDQPRQKVSRNRECQGEHFHFYFMLISLHFCASLRSAK
jgi:hypothetical protein